MIKAPFPDLSAVRVSETIEPAHRETCREILGLLKMAQGFELIFIECNQPALQEKLERLMEKQHSDFHWLKVRFDNEIRNLREELLERELSIEASSVLSIRGLQHSVHSEKSAAEVVARLNVARDILPKQFPCPMILWLPLHALQNFARFAPDLWSWRSGVFHFEEQPAVGGGRFAPHSELMSLPGDDKSDNYSKEFREGEIEFLTPLVEAFEPAGASPRSLKKHARNVNELATHHYRLSHFDEALPLFKAAGKIYQAIGDKAGEGATLNNISQIYDARGEYERALEYLEQSLAILQAIGDKAGEGATLNNISGIYSARGEYERALEYLEQSLAIRQAIGDVAGLCVTLFNIGHIHWQNEDQQQAVASWLAAYQLAKRLNLAQALDALENLAGRIGLEGGLEGWETLLQQTGGEVQEG
ncbi:MAG: tetratricopeptide repeat protein [bacterium]|nr:tetratricopeptide repeat protein [bacterium]